MSASHQPESIVSDAVPRLVRRTGAGALILALAGAVYLIWARGEAMIVDLAALGGNFWCF